MSSRVEDLEPDVQHMALTCLQLCAHSGLPLKITQTRRTWPEQQAIWDQGRKTPGSIVTHSPPGYSWHNFGRAFDVAFVGAHPYDPGLPGVADDDPIWEKVGAIGESVGLEWGGRWKHPDRPHFEHHGGQTLMARRLQAASDPEQVA